MDVEGSESKVLLGACNLLQRKAVERYAMATEHGAEIERRCVNELKRHGYIVSVKHVHGHPTLYAKVG